MPPALPSAVLKGLSSAFEKKVTQTSADVEECLSAHYCLCAQDFIDDRDVMPSITMENNVIHNNEGYGVIVVKPSNHEECRVSQDASEGMWRARCVRINECSPL